VGSFPKRTHGGVFGGPLLRGFCRVLGWLPRKYRVRRCRKRQRAVVGLRSVGFGSGGNGAICGGSPTWTSLHVLGAKRIRDNMSSYVAVWGVGNRREPVQRGRFPMTGEIWRLVSLDDGEGFRLRRRQSRRISNRFNLRRCGKLCSRTRRR